MMREGRRLLEYALGGCQGGKMAKKVSFFFHYMTDVGF